jgi:hypothetical protein
LPDFVVKFNSAPALRAKASEGFAVFWVAVKKFSLLSKYAFIELRANNLFCTLAAVKFVAASFPFLPVCTFNKPNLVFFVILPLSLAPNNIGTAIPLLLPILLL